ncbi:TonB-dependent receptor [Marinimicrobium sp. ABcell2]|uniref:TonB-dependent receptor n=1 Tax=Marinimicrobium sp. ABcell2 TaxID=3069751 RepID=UPI0027B76694|nr:TonB-dependent receptor [Marinimicrobium sp. ABcell2]MDQ2076605.1 TonB-dependent receptor [Marinimicrobium sp. ABcell2]
MKQPHRFKKKLIATAVASSALMGMSTGAMAQDGPVLEEVLVTGIRGSLTRAMDIKRDSSGVVDAISAEDIGKFPDTNLAESLQRITGVSISRSNGEGSMITVRGFGENYNMVTLNGRTMPAAAAPAGGAASGRGFDFAQLASESVSGVEVYKTSKANIASGGIGATVNINTARPLDNPGLNVSVGVKAMHDTTVMEGDDITPEVSGIFSWTDDNEMFGVGLSLSRQERHSGTVGAYVSGWSTREWVEPGTPGAMQISQVDGQRDITNAPAVGQLYGTPNDIRYTVSNHERVRTNGQLVLQFAPNDRLTATADYTYAENEQYQQRSELSLWYNQDANRVVFDTEHEVATPIIYSEFISDTSGKDTSNANQERHQVSKLESFGLNLDYQVTDSFNVTLDVHNSEARSLPNAPWGGSWINAGMGSRVVGAQATDYSRDLPIMTVQQISDCGDAMNCNNQHDIEDVGSQMFQIEYSLQETDTTQVRLDGTWEFDNGSIQFGIEDRVLESRAAHSQAQNAMGDWALAFPGDIPNEYLSPKDFTGQFNDYPTTSPDLGPAYNTAWAGSPEQIGRWGAEEYGFEFGPNPNMQTDRTVKEEIQAVYAQIGLEGNLGGMPTYLLLGARYEQTDVTSTAMMAVPEAIVWTGSNDFRREYSDESLPVSDTASYDHLLPSVDFSMDIRDDLVARFSYSKTIGRATYNHLSAAVGVDRPSRPTTPGLVSATASAGNPGLIPLESDNIDVSLEWYYDESSYASIGLFEKRVDNFIGTVPIDQTHFDLRDPTAGPRANAARAAVEELGLDVTEGRLFTMMVAQEQDLNFEDLDQDAVEIGNEFTANENDPFYVFATQTPVNNESAKIYGAEFALQHFFGETGFGVQTNYTIVRGDVGYDMTGEPGLVQFALEGLSDTANFSLLYENFGLSARLAYNWRDKYLANANRGGANPDWVEAYSQIDLNVSYDITDNFQVMFEGLNITEENSRRHARSPHQLWNLEQLGARYLIGARYTF